MPLYDDILREYQAQKQLEAGRSVMARPQQPEWRRKASPLTQTIMDMVGTLTGGSDPMSLGGGPSQAMITPGTWGLQKVTGESTGMQPEAKAMLNMMANRFPEFFQKILEAPANLLASVRPLGGGLYGSQSTLRPGSEATAKAIGMTTESPLSSLINVAPVAAKTLATPVHEAQHMLNFPRVQATSPEDAATIGTLLEEILPRPKGSLTNRLMELEAYRAEPADFPRGTPPGYLGGGFGPDLERGLRSADPIAGGRGYYKTGETTRDYLSRMAMDEALAYLGEQARGLTSMQPTPMVSKMASRLGVGPEMPSDIAEALQQLRGGGPQ